MGQMGRSRHDEEHMVPPVVPENGCLLALGCVLESEGGPMGKAVSASHGEGYLGKWFQYSKIRLLMQEEGAWCRSFRLM